MSFYVTIFFARLWLSQTYSGHGEFGADSGSVTKERHMKNKESLVKVEKKKKN
jgi:hypothetical protein